MEASLYERLGGREGIEAISTDLFDLHLENPLIKTRYADSDRAEVIRLVTEFFCAGTGGSEEYTGKDMPTAHAGMNISEQEFVAALDDVLLALDRNGVGQREKEEALMILYSLKSEVVRL